MEIKSLHQVICYDEGIVRLVRISLRLSEHPTSDGDTIKCQSQEKGKTNHLCQAEEGVHLQQGPRSANDTRLFGSWEFNSDERGGRIQENDDRGYYA